MDFSVMIDYLLVCHSLFNILNAFWFIFVKRSDMNRKIYHVSKTNGLSIIEPHICSHNKAYVYASYHLETSLLFGGELWTDWDFIYKRNYNAGELTLSETYPNIFQKTFKGKKCSVYELEDSGFLEGQTNMWDEIVSPNPAKVIREIKINDLAKEIKQLEKDNKIKVEFYSKTEEYKEKIKNHIKNLQIYSDIRDQKNASVILKNFKDFI